MPVFFPNSRADSILRLYIWQRFSPAFSKAGAKWCATFPAPINTILLVVISKSNIFRFYPSFFEQLHQPAARPAQVFIKGVSHQYKVFVFDFQMGISFLLSRSHQNQISSRQKGVGHLISQLVIKKIILIQQPVTPSQQITHGSSKTMCRLPFGFHGLLVQKAPQHLHCLSHNDKMHIGQSRILQFP